MLRKRLRDDRSSYRHSKALKPQGAEPIKRPLADRGHILQAEGPAPHCHCYDKMPRNFVSAVALVNLIAC